MTTTHSFDADVSQLIHLVTHSIYSTKEVFLRELLANANDAIQKAKLLAAQDPAYLGDETDLTISIAVDTDKKIITITDTGVGMSEEEVISNLGTIAKSGTKAFLEQMKQAKEDNALVGQFGIGFYSSFMVAHTVTVETKSAWDAPAVLRSSDGKWSYELTKSTKTTRGTTITLHLAEDAHEFADDRRIRWLITKHANYLPVAIMMAKLDDGKPTSEQEQVNKMQSLRSRPKSDVKPAEHNEFFQSLHFGAKEPFDTIHLHIEWWVTFKAVLYLPTEKSPFEQMMPDQDYGPALYVQNVMIMDHCKELLPQWLRFVKWVVETPDIPLNVSRELLQSQDVLRKIRTTLTNEVIKSLARQADQDDQTTYLNFLKNYGSFLKEGVYYDNDNKEKIAALLRFDTLLWDKKIGLDSYVATGNADKKEIYYLTGQSLAELKSSPYTESFKATKTDLLLMDEPLDEWVVQSLPEFKERKLISAAWANLDIPETKETKAKKKETEKKAGQQKDFLAFVWSTIGTEKLEKVDFTAKLTDSVAVLTTPEGQPSAQMEKYLQAMGQDMPASKKIFELNTDHPLTNKMIDLYSTDKESDTLKNLIIYSYEQAVLQQGGTVENMNAFIKRVNELVG